MSAPERPLTAPDTPERRQFAAGCAAPCPSIAFYYGHVDQTRVLAQFDVAVIEAGHGITPTQAPASPTQWLAYLSVGEVLATRPYFARMPADWLPGKNGAWDAWIVDPCAVAWPEFLVETIARPIHQQGFQGFFLDTVDSWRLLGGSADAQARRQRGMVRVIQALRQAFPRSVLVMNRGFELLALVQADIDAVAFESLYCGWDPQASRYVEIQPDARAWLLARVAALRQWRLPAIALDYCPPGDQALARSILQRIRQHGIVPSIADGHLNVIQPAGLLRPAHC